MVIPISGPQAKCCDPSTHAIFSFTVPRRAPAGLGFGGSLYLHVARPCSASAEDAWRWWRTFAFVPTCDPGVPCCHLLSALFCNTELFPTLLLCFSVSDDRKEIKVSSHCCMITCYQSSYACSFFGLNPQMSNYPVGISKFWPCWHIFLCVTTETIKLPHGKLHFYAEKCV